MATLDQEIFEARQGKGQLLDVIKELQQEIKSLKERVSKLENSAKEGV